MYDGFSNIQRIEGAVWSEPRRSSAAILSDGLRCTQRQESSKITLRICDKFDLPFMDDRRVHIVPVAMRIIRLWLQNLCRVALAVPQGEEVLFAQPFLGASSCDPLTQMYVGVLHK